MSNLPRAVLSLLVLLSLAACSTTRHGSDARANPILGLNEQARHAALAQAFDTGRRVAASGLRTPEDRRVYAQAVQQVVLGWQAAQGRISRDEPLVVPDNGGSWSVSASWPEGLRFDELVPAPSPQDRKLPRAITREGVGNPMVARLAFSEERKRQDPFLAEAGYLVAVTVTLEFPGRGSREGKAVLRMHESRTAETAVVAGRRQPLAADFSAPSEIILDETKHQHLGMSPLRALTHSDKYLDKLGLFTLEPPSRDRVPVILVHGLMSRPLTWQHAYNELTADPVIRNNCQMYFFRYPTGVPVVYSSAKFRAQLAALQAQLNRGGGNSRAHHTVLIGHSMGGLVSKAQVQESGDSLWINTFGAPPAELGLSRAEIESFREYVEFHPNPDVDRVIFVCTPHRGSKMAMGFVGAVGRRLVSLPGRVLGSTFDLLQGEALRNSHVKQLVARGIPSSIDNLSPKSRFVQISNQLPLKPGLHFHSIIGSKTGCPASDPKCSDGVVPYASAHLDGAESELIVHSNHGAHVRPEAIAEMKRILRLHLGSF